MKIISTITLTMFMSCFVFAQQTETLTLQPGAEQGKDAYVFQLDNQNTSKYGATEDKNYGQSSTIPMTDWTWGGNGKQRTFIEFDFSSIPDNAIITSAKLNLYHNPNQASWTHDQRGGTNEVLLQKVTESWTEDVITWNNKPATTTEGQIEIPKSSSKTQDYVIEVKSLVQTMLGEGNNHGFMMKLKTEAHYRSVMFSSSDYTDSTEHPKLVIEYELPVKRLVLKPGAKDGKDAYVFQLDNQNTSKYGATENKNYGESGSFVMTDWTWNDDGGGNGKQRSFIEFDFSSIPENAIITSATLNLYHPIPSSWGHEQLDGTNEVLLQKVTESWEEDVITWNNKPATTTEGQIEIPKSSSKTQDYSIEVKGLVQTMLGEGNNHGFMMKLKTESHYRSVIFSSSDRADSTEHPEIVIEYELPELTNIIATEKESFAKVYPNPFSNSTTFELGEVAEYTIVLFSSNGTIVKEVTKEASKIELSVENESLKGLYFYQISTQNNVVSSGKLVIK